MKFGRRNLVGRQLPVLVIQADSFDRSRIQNVPIAEFRRQSLLTVLELL